MSTLSRTQQCVLGPQFLNLGHTGYERVFMALELGLERLSSFDHACHYTSSGDCLRSLRSASAWVAGSSSAERGASDGRRGMSFKSRLAALPARTRATRERARS